MKATGSESSGEHPAHEPAANPRRALLLGGGIAAVLAVGVVAGLGLGKLTTPAAPAPVAPAPPAVVPLNHAAPARTPAAAKPTAPAATKTLPTEQSNATKIAHASVGTPTTTTPSLIAKAPQPTTAPAVAAIASSAIAGSSMDAPLPPATPDVASTPASPATAPIASSAPAAPSTAPAVAAAPAIQLAPPAVAAGLTDGQLEHSIRDGVDFLLSAFTDGELPPESDPVAEVHRRALHALCVYTLLCAGQTVQDPRLDPNGPVMNQLIEKLKAFDLTPRYNLPPQPIVYARSLRAAALAMRNKPADRAVLQADVTWLISAHCAGSYTFDDRHTNPAAAQYVRNVGVGPGGSNLPPGVRNVSVGGGGAAALDPNNKKDVEFIAKPGAPGVPISLYANPGGPTHFYGPPGGHSTTVIHIGGAPIATSVSSTKGTPPKATTAKPPVAAAPKATAARPAIGAATPPPEVRVTNVDPKEYFPWDNYNSQFAVMGVAAGADAGIVVPTDYWDAVQRHWKSCQLPDGTWPFFKGEKGNLAMTAGGLASVMIADDWSRRGNSLRRIANDPIPAEAVLALAWLEKGNNAIQIPTATSDFAGLDAFTILRAAQSFGVKYLGGHDWYLEIAQRFVAGQFPNGSWGRNPKMSAETMLDTAYSVAFLSLGRPPVMMNKLRHDDADWQNHPHDASNLARFTGKELERPLRWQVVDTSHDGTEWVDAPILYISGARKPRLRPAELAKIKSFVDAGGIVFTHADARGRDFSEWVTGTLAPALLPAGAKLDVLPNDHAIYTIVHNLKSKPRLLAGGNGARLTLVHSSDDIAANWDAPMDRDNQNAYDFGVNLYTYAIGKNPPRYRLLPPAPVTAVNPLAAFGVAQLKVGSAWDAEPTAWTQFSRRFYVQTGAVADFLAVPIAELSPQFALAHLVANAQTQLKPEEAETLRKYVEAGGVLVIESFPGDAAAADAVEKNILAEAFSDVTLMKADVTQPPLSKFQGVCDELDHKGTRPFLAERGQADSPLMQARVGKGYVIYSPINLSSGLANANEWGIAGYTPQYASSAMKDLLVWAGTRTK